jgi:hypothetical protein
MPKGAGCGRYPVVAVSGSQHHRHAHNPKVAGSNPAPATKKTWSEALSGQVLSRGTATHCNPLQPKVGGEAVERVSTSTAALTDMTRQRPLVSVVPGGCLEALEAFGHRTRRSASAFAFVFRETSTGWPSLDAFRRGRAGRHGAPSTR